MKQIQVQTVINSIRSRKDGSLGFSAETPEMTNQDKIEFMNLQNRALQAVFIPIESPNAPVYKVDKALDTKSQSVRLRNSLWVLWNSLELDEDFDTYYIKFMEKMISQVQGRIPEGYQVK